MVQLAEKIGPKHLREAVAKFDFGQKTGVELPGENGGLVYPLSRWTKPSPVSVAMGYEMMLTPLQLARGVSAYANGGKLLKPQVLHGIIENGGEVQPGKPKSEPPVAIDASTAATIRRIMCDVVYRGTGQKARSDTWVVFGKTGTSHTAKDGAYNEQNYTSSFVGGAPFESPRVIVAVVLHDPNKDVAHFGGAVAAPPAGKIIERTMAYLRVPPSPILTPPPANIAAVLNRFDPKIYLPRNEARTASTRE
jgi:cell division protein FtsI/penicillin-binding protein 2